MKIEQLLEILLIEKPSEELLKNEEELFKLIPELKECKNFNQNSEWHIYDVYTHILYVVDNVPANIILRLAALFHDIGKPRSYTEDENKKGHFYGHWKTSQEIFTNFANKYHLDKKCEYLISNLIYYHDINLKNLSDEQIEQLSKIFNREGISMLFKLKEADLYAQSEKYHYLAKDYSNQKLKILSKYKEK